MKINRQPFHMEHLVTYKDTCKSEDWEEGILNLESIILDEDLYQTAPMFFTISDQIGEPEYKTFEYFMPISWKAEFQSNLVNYLEVYELSDTLVIRQADQMDSLDDALNQLKTYAKDNNLILGENKVCLCTELYGEYIIDLFIEIEKDEGK